MNRGDILDEAKRLTMAEREVTYGSPSQNHQRIASFWSTFLEHEISPQDVALMMALVKVARLMQSPGHLDSVHDLCAYAAIAGELRP
tara:strand:+ start:870 stop:1130 length:261 start_codon:yes stop_codon:yes gene_type:complete